MESSSLNTYLELATLLEYIQTLKLSKFLGECLTFILSRKLSFAPQNYQKFLITPVFSKLVLSSLDLPFLIAHNSTFAEQLYGLQKAQLGGKNSKLMLVLVCAIFDYLVPLFNEVIESKSVDSFRSLRSLKLKNILPPVIRSIVIALDSVYSILYLTEVTNFPSFAFFLSRYLLVESQNEASISKYPSSRGRRVSAIFRFAHSVSKNILQLHAVLTFMVQFQDFWSVEKGKEKDESILRIVDIIPTAPGNEKSSLLLSCNVCGKPREQISEQVASAVCGHLFCFACAKSSFNRSKMCPKCKLKFSTANVIKLIEM